MADKLGKGEALDSHVRSEGDAKQKNDKGKDVDDCSVLDVAEDSPKSRNLTPLALNHTLKLHPPP